MASVQRFKYLMRTFDISTKHAQKVSHRAESAARSRKPLVETKHRIMKSTQRFNIENWIHTPEMCVGRFVAAEDTVYGSLKGSFSWGVWWKDENIGAYRIHDPFGNLITYRLDILRDVKMTSASDHDIIEFSDMIVDCWIWPDSDGAIDKKDITVDDLDELKSAREAGKVRVQDYIMINNVTWDVLSHPQKYVTMIDVAIAEAIALNEQ